MAARLAQVERELLAARREILEKVRQDIKTEFRSLSLFFLLSLLYTLQRRIKQLEEQTAILKASSSSSSHSTSELQQRCLALQEQVDEMEVH